MSSKPLIHVVEVDPLVIQAVTGLLEPAGFECRHASSGPDFLAGFDARRPGCVLSEVLLPQMSGLELQRRLADVDATYPVIFLTTCVDVPTAVQAMKAGAMDYMTKPFNRDSLLDAVTRAVRDHAESCRIRQHREEVCRRLELVSPREREVLEMVVQGKPTKQIAGELGLSTKTIDNHRASIMSKTGASSVVELVRLVLAAEASRSRLTIKPFFSKAS